MAHTLFIVIIALLLFNYFLDRLLDYLNDKNWSNQIPEEMQGYYDAEKYKKSRAYDKAKSKFGAISATFSLALMLAMLFFDGFAILDNYVRTITENPILLSLLFFGILYIASDLLSIPFSVYGTFVIEEKFGFNKTTPKTFILDKLKGYALAIIVGGLIIGAMVWFYQIAGAYFWLFAWGLMTFFMVFATMFYASLILPLFNKLTPLEDGELKQAITEYANKVGFKLDNIFVIDGSKRSNKANAFFSGLGAKKKIVLYDTLINNHTTEELVAVLAHEVGHYKKKHTLLSVVLGIIQAGIMLFVLGLALNMPVISEAVGVNKHSFHIGVLVFSLLYSPISMLLGVAMNGLSRKNEFEADEFAVKTYDGAALQTALKKLSVHSLSNLYPHWLDVFINYSHPPLLVRLKAMKAIK